jgi:hypothetical protein
MGNTDRQKREEWIDNIISISLTGTCSFILVEHGGNIQTDIKSF